jgi:hypothetical protein
VRAEDTYFVGSFRKSWIQSQDDPCEIHYSYLITWDQANSAGDNKKIYNKNYDKARTFVELG